MLNRGRLGQLVEVEEVWQQVKAKGVEKVEVETEPQETIDPPSGLSPSEVKERQEEGLKALQGQVALRVQKWEALLVEEEQE